MGTPPSRLVFLDRTNFDNLAEGYSPSPISHINLLDSYASCDLDSDSYHMHGNINDINPTEQKEAINFNTIENCENNGAKDTQTEEIVNKNYCTTEINAQVKEESEKDKIEEESKKLEEIRKIEEKFNFYFGNIENKVFSLSDITAIIGSDNDNDKPLLKKKRNRSKKSDNVNPKNNINSYSPKINNKIRDIGLFRYKFKVRKSPLKDSKYYSVLKKTENFRKTCLYAPMIFLKDYSKQKYKIKFEGANCKKMLGNSIGYMKRPLTLKVYQLLSIGKKGKKNIDALSKIMKTSKDKNEELILFFLVTRTYEELYNSYIFNNFKFKYIKENKEITITDFINLDKKIEKIRKKLEKEKKEEKFISLKIAILTNLSKNMIKDINNEKGKKQAKKETSLETPQEIQEFEDLRKKFIALKDIQGMELEEK